jgi:Protein of unknown function (DUF2964)
MGLTAHAGEHHCGERAMVQGKFRIVLATIAVFAALAGLGVAIHGLAFDADRAFRYGIGAIVIGVAVFVFLLNPAQKDET